MPSTHKGWLPREGFTLDVVHALVSNTLLNPLVTVPLWVLARYNDRARGVALDHPVALGRLKTFMYLGLARILNNILNQRALNNATTAKFDWKRELVLITGGSDGFGKLLTLRFSELGTRVIILDVQKPTFTVRMYRTRYTVPLTNQQASNVTFFKCDLSNPEEIKEVCSQIKSTIGDPTVVINNAGIGNHQTIVNIPDKALERVVAVNQIAHYRIAREFLPAITRKNHGMFVTVASLAGFVTPAGIVDYCGTKAAAVAFHEGLAAELAYRYAAPKVRTILVAPAFAATKLIEGFEQKSKFVSPLLHPETVTDAIFDQIMSGNSGIVTVPKSNWWLAMNNRFWPLWMSKGLSKQLAELMATYNVLPPRDTIDPELYSLFIQGKIKPGFLTRDQRLRYLRGDVSKEEMTKWIEEERDRIASA